MLPHGPKTPLQAPTTILRHLSAALPHLSAVPRMRDLVELRTQALIPDRFEDGLLPLPR